jgi:hypothetical protein
MMQLDASSRVNPVGHENVHHPALDALITGSRLRTQNCIRFFFAVSLL